MADPNGNHHSAKKCLLFITTTYDFTKKTIFKKNYVPATLRYVVFLLYIRVQLCQFFQSDILKQVLENDDKILHLNQNVIGAEYDHNFHLLCLFDIFERNRQLIGSH